MAFLGGSKMTLNHEGAYHQVIALALRNLPVRNWKVESPTSAGESEPAGGRDTGGRLPICCSLKPKSRLKLIYCTIRKKHTDTHSTVL